jgi:excisionase family DNA binding protein
MTDQLMKFNDVAKTLNCTVSCVRRWRREGRIAVVKLGKLVRVSEAEVSRIAKDGLRPTRKGARP